MRLRWNGSSYSGQLRRASLPPTVALGIAPGVVRRGGTLSLSLPPGFEGCALDVAYRMPEDELLRSGTWRVWAKLDQSGRGTAHIDQDIERGRVVIDQIRACNRDWAPALGSFMIWP